jgi:hypothetical protein
VAVGDAYDFLHLFPDHGHDNKLRQAVRGEALIMRIFPEGSLVSQYSIFSSGLDKF